MEVHDCKEESTKPALEAAAEHGSATVTERPASEPADESEKQHQEAPAATGAQEGLSKNAQKRMLKKQKHDETKREKRREARERKKAKKAQEHATAALEPRKDGASGPVTSKGKGGGGGSEADKDKEEKPFGAGIVVDLGFDEVMSERECASMALQLTYVYSSNRSSSTPISNVTFVGRGEEKDCFEYSTTTAAELQSPHPSYFVHHRALASSSSSTSNGQGSELAPPLSLRQSRVGHMKEIQDKGAWNRWQRITIQDTGGLESLVKGRESDFVYLSADAPHTITELAEEKSYIIGGLVDRNRYKNICLNKANSLGIPSARLPLNEAQLGGKKVLAVNHVVDILLGWIETRDWDMAVDKGLPGRRAKLENGMQPESKRKKKRERGRSAEVEASSIHIDEADEEEAFNSSRPPVSSISAL